MISSSRGGFEVELWTNNSLPSISVDQIPLGDDIPAIFMFYDLYGPYVPQTCVIDSSKYYPTFDPDQHPP